MFCLHYTLRHNTTVLIQGAVGQQEPPSRFILPFAHHYLLHTIDDQLFTNVIFHLSYVYQHVYICTYYMFFKATYLKTLTCNLNF